MYTPLSHCHQHLNIYLWKHFQYESFSMQPRDDQRQCSKTLQQPCSTSAIVNNFLQSKAKGITLDELTSEDVIVAVMGPTGSGKSSFIETATGITGIVGHGLESFTNEISAIKLSFPGLDLCFVDTPGFDDTNKSDLYILKMISDWLLTTYDRDIRLSGLLYFHRISDNRMAGTPLKNFHLFEKVCGNDFHKIVLTTTMWDQVDDDVGDGREEELKAEYWRSMVERGSHVKRFLYTRESAFEILAPVLDEVQTRSALLLQKEMNDLGLLLKETSAGKTLSVELQELVLRHQGILGKIQSELKNLTGEPDQLQILMDEYQKVSAQLQRAFEDLQTMKTSPVDWTVAGLVRVSRTVGLSWRKIVKLSKRLEFFFGNSEEMQQAQAKDDKKTREATEKDVVSSESGGLKCHDGELEPPGKKGQGRDKKPGC